MLLEFEFTTLDLISVWQWYRSLRLLVTLVRWASDLDFKLNCGAVSSSTNDVELARLVVVRSNVTRLRILGSLSSVEQLMINAARFVCLSLRVNRVTRAPFWNSIVIRGALEVVAVVLLPWHCVTVRPVKCVMVLILRLKAVNFSMLTAFLVVPLTVDRPVMLILCTRESLVCCGGTCSGLARPPVVSSMT